MDMCRAPAPAELGVETYLSPPCRTTISPQELRHEGGCLTTTHEVTRGSLAKELREPRLVLDFLIEDRQRQIVRSVVLAGGQVTDVGVSPHRAALCLDQNVQ